MLFPTDPDKRPDLWSAFAGKVAAGSISFVIHSGERLSEKDRQAPIVEGVDDIVNSFRSADVVRFGSSRGSAIGPFLAFDLEAGGARLVEYAFDSGIQAPSDEAMQEALQSVAINLFFERKEISCIFLRIALPKWDAVEWEASAQGGVTVLRRKVPKL
ncbi:hypothetical protein [Dyella tabacisoli]|uniref:Uncharacterized protein n=1 Tax=Dyella tabacisoli TaxID=2282381 RepID=A0A369UGV3_9GAMM|nr:hypothetical protein [Dyella tabacisoli]RDD79776.1 hypothetical protein DVJ77_20580 [Dyella tabacisoli]